MMDGPPFFYMFHLRFRKAGPSMGVFGSPVDFTKGNTDDNINAILSQLCGNEATFNSLKSYSFRPLSHKTILSAAADIALVGTKPT